MSPAVAVTNTGPSVSQISGSLRRVPLATSLAACVPVRLMSVTYDPSPT